MAQKIICNCDKCNCQEEFEPIDKEELLNLISHGRVNQAQMDFLKKRVGSVLCKRCFVENH